MSRASAGWSSADGDIDAKVALRLAGLDGQDAGRDRKLITIDRLAIAAGDRIALLGANGAGKSTLLSALARAFDPDARALRQPRAGAVQPGLPAGLFRPDACATCRSTRRSSTMSLDAQGISEKDAIRHLAPAGFPFERIGEPIGVLSHGERARLVFLKMKLLRPNMYLLDEPTNHLDIEGQEDLEEQLEQSDVSCLFVSHDRYFTRTVATRFLEIRKGRLVEIDDPRELLRSLARITEGWSDGPAPRRSPAHRRADDPPAHRTGRRSLAADHRRDAHRWSSWSTAAATICFGSATTSPSPLPILDPLLQLAQAAVVSRRLQLGTGVYLLPLRHPTPVAKQVSTLDHLTEGRFIFGVGVGGEFPKEYEACGVPIGERGARLRRASRCCASSGAARPATHDGRFFPFADVTMQPPPRQAGGPPIWCGGRSDAALRRVARMTDGWMSYVVTPDMFRQGLDKIAAAAATAGRVFDRGFGTAHLLFTRHRRHLRESARRRDPLAQPALRDGLSQGRRSATARSDRGAGRRDAFVASMRRAPATSFSTSSAPTRSVSGDRAFRPRGAATARGPARP